MESYTKLKDKGNDLFKQKNFEESVLTFESAISLLEDNEPRQSITDSTQVGKIFVILNINSALAALNIKTKQYYKKAQHFGSKAIQIDQKNQKALYRRGLAYKQYAQLLETESYSESSQLLELYNRAKVDLQNLVILDKANDLAKQKLSETIKNIYRVTVSKGKQADLLGNITVKVEQPKKVQQIKKDAPVVKKYNDMNKILKEYKIEEVTNIARQKVQLQYLTQELPKTRAQLEKALREIDKSPQVCLKFIYRMTDDYLKKIQPTFDMLFQILEILIKIGTGEQAKLALSLMKIQKSFDLLWKSYSSGQKKRFKQKWVQLGLQESQLK